MAPKYLPVLLMASALVMPGSSVEAVQASLAPPVASPPTLSHMPVSHSAVSHPMVARQVPAIRPIPASATEQTFHHTLAMQASHTLHFPGAVAKVDVDKDGIVAVRAPDAHSLVVTGVGPGDAIVKVYSADGAVVSSGVISVVPAQLPASAALAQDPRMRHVRAVRAGGRVALVGDVDSLAAHAAAKDIAARADDDGPAPQVVNATDVTGQQVVAVDVQFIAVSATTLNELGFNFSKLSGNIQGAVVSPSATTSFSQSSAGLALSTTSPLAGAFNLFLGSNSHGLGAVMSALSQTGLSQVLAQPTLLVRSGEEAHFLAGGEIPIPVPQSTGGTTSTVTIQFKEFGVRLTVAPTVLDHGRIVLRIAPEVSELDYTNGVQIQGFTIPGIKRRSADTTVQLGNGQSFVLAGLSYTENTVTKDKVPLLGDLPVLGTFFRNQSSQKERQELIIVATPRLVSPMKAETASAMTASINGEAPELTMRDMVLGANDTDLKDVSFGVVRR
jgi:pilus assembly protein CpaC